MHWRAVKGTAPQPAVPGWHRLEMPPMPRAAWVRGSSAKGRTHLRGSRACTGEWEEVQWEKTASCCKTSKYLKFPCSTGASQGLLHRSGQVTYINPPKTAKYRHTGHQNRAQFKGESRWQRKSPYTMMVRNGKSQKGAGEIKTNDKCDWKRRKTIQSISRYPCPARGGWHRWAHGCSSFCCSSIIILLWQSLMDRLFCYLANSSLKHLSPTHEYIHTCMDTHLGTVSGTTQAWSKAELQSSHARRMSGCLLTALQLQNPVLANDFSKPCCTKENRFNLYISA